MLVVTTDELPGYEVRQVLGEVIGATCRLRNPFFDKIRTLPYGDMNPRRTAHLVRWRQEVVDEMVKAARKLGANAVIGMRFDNRDISDVWGEMCAYGTAVCVTPLQAEPGQPAEPLTVPAEPAEPGQTAEPATVPAATARGQAAVP